MTDIVKNILDVVEEIHVTSRHGVTKPKWRELMRRFKTGEQIYTSYQAQIEPDKDDQYKDEEVDFNDNNENYIQLQNYLSVVGQWLPRSLIDSKKVRCLQYADTKISKCRTCTTSSTTTHYLTRQSKTSLTSLTVTKLQALEISRCQSSTMLAKYRRICRSRF